MWFVCEVGVCVVRVCSSFCVWCLCGVGVMSECASVWCCFLFIFLWVVLFSFLSLCGRWCFGSWSHLRSPRGWWCCVPFVRGVAVSSLHLGRVTLSTLLLLGAACFLSLLCDDVLFLFLLLLGGAASPLSLGWCCLPFLFLFGWCCHFLFFFTLVWNWTQ